MENELEFITLDGGIFSHSSVIVSRYLNEYHIPILESIDFRFTTTKDIATEFPQFKVAIYKRYHHPRVENHLFIFDHIE